MVVQDTHKNIFGAYLNDHLRNLDGKYYYGNGDCFLWKCEKGKMKHLDPVTKSETKGSPQDELVLKVFPYTSLNDFIYTQITTSSVLDLVTENSDFG